MMPDTAVVPLPTTESDINVQEHNNITQSDIKQSNLTNSTQPSTNINIKMNCAQWADCSCDATETGCKCGQVCKCGTVSLDTYNQAVSTRCGKTDCSCGASCQCGSGCGCGSTERTREQWIELLKGEQEGEENQ